MAPTIYTRTCPNPACGLTYPTATKTQVYCSPACVVAVQGSPLTREACRRGGVNSAELRRARALKRLQGLTQLEAFRLGYCQGYNKGLRHQARAEKARTA